MLDEDDAVANGGCARGVVVKGIFGDVRRKESLLGDALRLGVAETRLLWSNNTLILGQEGEVVNSRSILSRMRGVRDANSHNACLDEEIPDSTCLIHIDLDKISRLTTTKLPSTSSVFTNEGFFDSEV